MIKFNNIIKESISKQDMLRIYQKLYPQLSFAFEEEEAVKYMSKLIDAYAVSIGEGNRTILNKLTKDDSLRTLWDFIFEEIGHEYGSSTIELTRGLSASAYNSTFEDWKVGDVVSLEAYDSDLIGFTDDDDISDSFAKCGDGLPQGYREEDAQYSEQYQAVNTIDNWSTMIGFVFSANIPIQNNIFFAPKLLENEFFKELFELASQKNKGYSTTYELMSEREFIIRVPIDVKIIEGYVFCNDPDYMEWESVKHPWKVRREYDKLEDEGWV
jgi:hypothetical protein